MSKKFFLLINDRNQYYKYIVYADDLWAPNFSNYVESARIFKDEGSAEEILNFCRQHAPHTKFYLVPVSYELPTIPE